MTEYINKEDIQTRGYESPISLRIQQIAEEAAKKVDDEICTAVKAVVEVDEAELLKALKYDRDQYAKGYEKGYENAFADMVRCKDCIYGHYDSDVGDYDCNEIGDRWHSHDGDWFCANGRKEE